METSNYGLNQWESTDRIQMEDFNADNAKIDAALKAEQEAREAADAELTAQLLQKITATELNQILVTGTYIGTGGEGALAMGPGSVDLGFKPRLLLVRDTTYSGHSSTLSDTGWTSYNLAIATPEFPHYAFGSELYLEITETGFNTNGHMNYKDRPYFYLALR